MMKQRRSVWWLYGLAALAMLVFADVGSAETQSGTAYSVEGLASARTNWKNCIRRSKGYGTFMFCVPQHDRRTALYVYSYGYPLPIVAEREAENRFGRMSGACFRSPDKETLGPGDVR